MEQLFPQIRSIFNINPARNGRDIEPNDQSGFFPTSSTFMNAFRAIRAKLPKRAKERTPRFIVCYGMNIERADGLLAIYARQDNKGDGSTLRYHLITVLDLHDKEVSHTGLRLIEVNHQKEFEGRVTDNVAWETGAGPWSISYNVVDELHYYLAAGARQVVIKKGDIYTNNAVLSTQVTEPELFHVVADVPKPAEPEQFETAMKSSSLSDPIQVRDVIKLKLKDGKASDVFPSTLVPSTRDVLRSFRERHSEAEVVLPAYLLIPTRIARDTTTIHGCCVYRLVNMDASDTVTYQALYDKEGIGFFPVSASEGVEDTYSASFLKPNTDTTLQTVLWRHPYKLPQEAVLSIEADKLMLARGARSTKGQPVSDTRHLLYWTLLGVPSGAGHNEEPMIKRDTTHALTGKAPTGTTEERAQAAAKLAEELHGSTPSATDFATLLRDTSQDSDEGDHGLTGRRLGDRDYSRRLPNRSIGETEGYPSSIELQGRTSSSRFRSPEGQHQRRDFGQWVPNAGLRIPGTHTCSPRERYGQYDYKSMPPGSGYDAYTRPGPVFAGDAPWSDRVSLSTMKPEYYVEVLLPRAYGLLDALRAFSVPEDHHSVSRLKLALRTLSMIIDQDPEDPVLSEAGLLTYEAMNVAVGVINAEIFRVTV